MTTRRRTKTHTKDEGRVPRRRWAGAIAASAVVVALALLAAPAGATTPRPPSPKSLAFQAAVQNSALAAALDSRRLACMRRRGIPLSGPGEAGGSKGSGEIGGKSAVNPQSAKYKAAQKACDKEIGPLELRVVACLRANGIPLPDPEEMDRSAPGGMGVDRRPVKLTAAEKAKLKAALKECRNVLPRKA